MIFLVLQLIVSFVLDVLMEKNHKSHLRIVPQNAHVPMKQSTQMFVVKLKLSHLVNVFVFKLLLIIFVVIFESILLSGKRRLKITWDVKFLLYALIMRESVVLIHLLIS